MGTDLQPGANLALPDDRVELRLAGPFDLSAVVLGAAGTVAGDTDFVFFNQPSAPGVALGAARVTVTPGRLRPGAARVVVLASPEEDGRTFGSLPAPTVTLTGSDGTVFARLVPPALRSETAVQLAEVYRRADRWRLRAIGQGYTDGLAGLARDFGVDVEEESPRPTRRGTTRPRANDPAGRAGAGADIVNEVVAATNAERRKHGLAPLTVDPRLAAVPHDHSADMVGRAFFSHENPDGAQVWDRAVAAGYRYRKVAENIAAGQRTAAEVVTGWMNSPGHRRNILDGDLTQIGVGHVLGGTYGVVWTQVFGTPMR